MNGFFRPRAHEASGDHRGYPGNVGDRMEAAVPEVEGLRQRTLQLVGRDQANQQFLSAAPILLGNCEEPGRGVATMAGGTATTQNENVIGVQIANHGAIDQRSQLRRDLPICAQDRRLGAATLFDSISPYRLSSRCVVGSNSASHAVSQVSPGSGRDFRRDGSVRKPEGKIGHHLRESPAGFGFIGHVILYLKLSLKSFSQAPFFIMPRSLKLGGCPDIAHSMSGPLTIEGYTDSPALRRRIHCGGAEIAQKRFYKDHSVRSDFPR